MAAPLRLCRISLSLRRISNTSTCRRLSSTEPETAVRTGAPSAPEYRRLRLQQLAPLAAPLYPLDTDSLAAARPVLSHHQFTARFNPICQQPGAWLSVSDPSSTTNSDVGDATLASEVCVIGRVVMRRDAGKNLFFLVLERDSTELQIVINRKHWPDASSCPTGADNGPSFSSLSDAIGLGDLLFVAGRPGRTKAGQLSLLASQINVLAPCLRRFPKKNSIITDENVRFRQRYLDMFANLKTTQTFRTRSKLISRLRSFLDAREFVEVETPILSAMAGGANAKPFRTRAESLNMDLELRVAPELFLKQLVVGGLERVYEIGKQFRNEGIDTTHNPEFTTCELYQAYTTLPKMMAMTEEILLDLVRETTGGSTIEGASPHGDTTHTIDFAAPYRRIDIRTALQEAVGDQPLPDLDDPASVPDLLSICKQRGIRVNSPVTLSRVVDKLVSDIIEPQCIQPTFVTGHPLSMSPLAKQDPYRQQGTAARFELFVATRELANAYVELNDPCEQRRRFTIQASDREAGDTEAQPLDEAFCVALEHGLPPTVGWGLGIDRLCMLVTASPRIRDVIAFPILRSTY